MSLIPYHPQEGREIVLRHRNAIVVRDPASQRLAIRSVTECPTCHQPLRPSSPDRHGFEASSQQDSYVDPGYFRMLRAGHGEQEASEPPSSPIRRLIRPVLPQAQPAAFEEVDDAEFVSSTPRVQQGSRIRREAFSPNYFNTFFVEERELGRGGKGVVLLVRHEIDGCHLGHFACKRVPVGDDHAWLEKVLIEVELLAKLSHPNLVSYRHVWLEDVKLIRFGPSVACAFILQQYCNGGDLLNYINGDQPKQTTKEELKARLRRRSKGQSERAPVSQRHLSFEEIYSLFRDVTSGLSYLHAANYIHRDLKPSNCLLHREGGNLICLISDFGEVQPGGQVRNSTGSTGTISYCAPEVLKKDHATGFYGNFTTKSDIFSLGMILYFMCFGRLPYQNANTINEELEDIDELRAEITDWQGFQDERRERPDLPPKLYQLLKRLSREVLKKDHATGFYGNFTTKSDIFSLGMILYFMCFGRLPYQNANTINEELEDIDELRAEITDWQGFQDERRERPDLPPKLYQLLKRLLALDPVQRPSANEVLAAMKGETILDGIPPGRSSSPSMGLPGRGFRTSIPQCHQTPRPRGDIQHKLVLAGHYGSQLAGLSEASAPLLLRLGIFFGKLATLARPCWPYMFNPWIGASLIALAALDLGILDARSRRGSMHDRAGWIGQRRNTVDSLGTREVRTSALLLLLHFAVLWTAQRWAPLCAMVPQPWHELPATGDTSA
ncbi:serine/threonine-protein kinase IKS1 like [Verticillium longisporum]|uniref:non-specific serine/threonine protein kinase n=1 Tax=Verticillium longisporum TaxID=100787 RepID=A0A8I2Z6B9_VERLO|nr:serine/threonine-protein kinase IKS1 like [Verticillium longisporum]